MKNLINKFWVLVFMVFTPVLVLAQEETPLVPDCGFDCDLDNFFTLFNNVVDFITFSIAVPLTVLMIAGGGIYYLFNFSKSDNLAKGKSMIYSGVIGLVIVLSAYLIIKVIVVTLVDPDAVDVDKIFNDI